MDVAKAQGGITGQNLILCSTLGKTVKWATV